MTSAPSGRLYSAVTKYWPRIAAGLVVVSGLIEFVVGGMTADSGVEFYMLAWAATTGGVWFVFEKAEQSLSEASRTSVVEWMSQRDAKAALRALPAQFAMLFDRIFGEKHLSLKCFGASCAVSFVSAVVVYALTLTAGVWAGVQSASWALLLLIGIMALASITVRLFPAGEEVKGKRALYALGGYAFIAGAVWLFTLTPWLDELTGAIVGIGVGLWAIVLFNFLPDYLALLETRWAIGWMSRGGNVPGLLLVDLGLTALAWTILPSLLLVAGDLYFGWDYSALFLLFAPLQVVFVGGVPGIDGLALAGIQLSFLTTFVTSAWLWIYLGAVFLSHLMLRMNSGVGFLLRVTDVERQPFRSMGFVSVIIVSALFALGLPLVLL